nr:MAG TPA: hypothetical protein [Caudoviricetes sp.]
MTAQCKEVKCEIGHSSFLSARFNDMSWSISCAPPPSCRLWSVLRVCKNSSSHFTGKAFAKRVLTYQCPTCCLLTHCCVVTPLLFVRISAKK